MYFHVFLYINIFKIFNALFLFIRIEYFFKSCHLFNGTWLHDENVLSQKKRCWSKSSTISVFISSASVFPNEAVAPNIQLIILLSACLSCSGKTNFVCKYFLFYFIFLFVLLFCPGCYSVIYCSLTLGGGNIYLLSNVAETWQCSIHPQLGGKKENKDSLNDQRLTRRIVQPFSVCSRCTT